MLDMVFTYESVFLNLSQVFIHIFSLILRNQQGPLLFFCLGDLLVELQQKFHHPIPRFSFYAQLQKTRNWGTCKRFDLGGSSQVVVKKGQFWSMIIKGSSLILQNHQNSMGRRQSFATSQIYQSYSFLASTPGLQWHTVSEVLMYTQQHYPTVPTVLPFWDEFMRRPCSTLNMLLCEHLKFHSKPFQPLQNRSLEHLVLSWSVLTS